MKYSLLFIKLWDCLIRFSVKVFIYQWGTLFCPLLLYIIIEWLLDWLYLIISDKVDQETIKRYPLVYNSRPVYYLRLLSENPRSREQLLAMVLYLKAINMLTLYLASFLTLSFFNRDFLSKL